jgi:hypothetical protein
MNSLNSVGQSLVEIVAGVALAAVGTRARPHHGIAGLERPNVEAQEPPPRMNGQPRLKPFGAELPVAG